MRIGYDAKRIFHNRTGLGNYGRDILRIMNSYPEMEEFFLFNTKTPSVNRKIALEKSTIIYPTGWFWKNFPALWRLFGQWNQINHLKLDWYHGLSGEIPIQLKKQGTAKIVTIHDLIFISHPKYYNFWDRVIYRLKFYYAVHAADHIVAISEQTKRDIIKFLKVSPDKITVVYQGCHNAFKTIYSEEQKNEIRARYFLPEQFILNVGTIQERKNVLAIIKSIKGTNYHLALVGGEKSYAKKVRRYIQEHNMQKQVTFVKKISVQDLAILYQAATLLCYPSYCEGFGIPLIEALFSKIPIIVTKGGCFPEAAGPDAIYINPDNTDEILQNIKKLYEYPELRKELAEKGYSYVQKFNDENVGASLVALYKKIG
ncbi:glycosyltransferase family 1 protein [uncultured Zobellia sp.]|uniref:glycosyltransferase family 4 protein n=1 Tax=uncultured Zobellia sp. TaxID=255433 RepID=UPI0025946102|nr:glycosyltransferase family 1 protein [uncultured Zobellia sp.]